MQQSDTMHEEDRKKLGELEDVKRQYEERLMEINTVTENLQDENESLRADAQLWKERADAYLNENIALQGVAEDLRLQNSDLRSKVRRARTPTCAVHPLHGLLRAAYKQRASNSSARACSWSS